MYKYSPHSPNVSGETEHPGGNKTAKMTTCLPKFAGLFEERAMLFVYTSIGTAAEVVLRAVYRKKIINSHIFP